MSILAVEIFRIIDHMANIKTPAAKAGSKPKAGATKQYTREQLDYWYEMMLRIRRFEEKAGQLYGQQKIRGFCHLYIGQEAVACGMETAIRKDDAVITAYRDHGNALARGMSSRSVMAELYGKVTGCSKGMGGSMHMFSNEHHFYGGHGLVGQQIPLGAGLAFAFKYQGTDRIAVAMFGDGAARQGALHETFNLAMMWKLPVVFICENNFYAMGTSVERSSNVTDIYKLGLAYDMPSRQVNGMDVMAMHEAMVEAAEHCRSGKGPIFLEVRTYRYKGHSMSDPAKYRTKDELNAYKDQDPIIILKKYLLENGYYTEAQLEAVEEKIMAEVLDSVEFSEQSPYPDAQQLYELVYAEKDYPFVTEI